MFPLLFEHRASISLYSFFKYTFQLYSYKPALFPSFYLFNNYANVKEINI